MPREAALRLHRLRAEAALLSSATRILRKEEAQSARTDSFVRELTGR